MNVLLLQLPVPQLTPGRRTGNIPLGAACLAQAVGRRTDGSVSLVPERLATHLGDAALLEHLLARKPDAVGFTVFCWNLERSLYLADALKARRPGIQILFGGPEITPDNDLIPSSVVDFRGFGEGEAVFREFLATGGGKTEGSASADAIFRSARSPYLSGLLEPEIGDTVLVETQRGCPYRCGYCFYGKSRRGVLAAERERVLEAVRHARERKVGEVYLLDPCLNARPDLAEFLEALAAENPDRAIAFHSEIRAERVDRAVAEAFARAGFREFEIGLQTVTPEALRQMNRPTDPARFRAGVRHLQTSGIRPRIDLIIGLPGDTPEGFRRSLDFVADLDAAEDAQVFFLSVLPGTDFRRRRAELGLRFQARPPYTVLETATFSPSDMAEAFEAAEDALELNLAPEPDLHLAFRPARALLGEDEIISAVALSPHAEPRALEAAARRLGHPYQLFIPPESRDQSHVRRALEILTAANPHTPLEIVFLEPESPPDIPGLEAALQLDRPLFLDRDQPHVGGESVLFTRVGVDPARRFFPPFHRQVFWWKRPAPPTPEELRGLEALDGVLLDTDLSESEWKRWQDRNAPAAEDLPPLTFADLGLQRRWLRLTAPEEYWPGWRGAIRRI